MFPSVVWTRRLSSLKEATGFSGCLASHSVCKESGRIISDDLPVEPLNNSPSLKFFMKRFVLCKRAGRRSIRGWNKLARGKAANVSFTFTSRLRFGNHHTSIACTRDYRMRAVRFRKQAPRLKHDDHEYKELHFRKLANQTTTPNRHLSLSCSAIVISSFRSCKKRRLSCFETKRITIW